MTTRRSFLASLLALPVVAKAVWSVAPASFDGKTMRLRVGQSMKGPGRGVYSCVYSDAWNRVAVNVNFPEDHTLNEKPVYIRSYTLYEDRAEVVFS